MYSIPERIKRAYACNAHQDMILDAWSLALSEHGGDMAYAKWIYGEYLKYLHEFCDEKNTHFNNGVFYASAVDA